MNFVSLGFQNTGEAEWLIVWDVKEMSASACNILLIIRHCINVFISLSLIFYFLPFEVKA